MGTSTEVNQGLEWLAQQAHEHKLLVPGNHDFLFEKHPDRVREMCLERGITLLVDESIRLGGLQFYGSPWQPEYGGWAYNLRRGTEIAQKWAMIPYDTDVLITHGPPAEILDETQQGYHVGCYDLLDAVKMIHPQVHCFGHIHESYGVTRFNKTLMVNCSVQPSKGFLPVVVTL